MSPPPTAAQDAPPAWYGLTPEEALGRTNSRVAGLTDDEAATRLAADGPNQLQESAGVRPLDLLLGQFKSLIVWILIVAGIVSGILGEFLDAAAILGIVVLNALIGFYQEYHAEKSIAALRDLTAPQARVRRQGAVQTIPVTGIVVGDVLELEAGDLVPADARLLEAASLRCVESALTGESEAVDKDPARIEVTEVDLGDRVNQVFMGTAVAAGQGLAVVVATGMKTELGRIAGLLQEAGVEGPTPLQRNLNAFGRLLVWVSLGIVALMFVLGLARGAGLLELFMTSVSLAVAAVPEGLPAVVTVALALGVRRMSRRRALVRRLSAVETLGSTSVICTDKTGTLTAGKMTARELFAAGRTYQVSGEGYDPEGKITPEDGQTASTPDGALRELAGILVGCNASHLQKEDGVWKVVGDPTEGALLAVGLKAGVDAEQLERDWPKQAEFPFDSDRKRRSVVRRLPDGRLRVLVNGAPDLLLTLCTRILAEDGVRAITDGDRQAVAARNAEMAGKALRVLGSAYRDLEASPAEALTAARVEQELIFAGLTGMYDPPRPEAMEAVAKCQSAGIRVVMITGDHPRTALAVAQEIGIAAPGNKAMTGAELDKIPDPELVQAVLQIPVYARVTAEHKLRIVRAWKANKAVVAMTGDGVNDAPAIKGADIGVAMGRNGTEVTKQAADIVITDDNFATIVAAVEEGRGIYDNIRKTLQYLLAGNFGELLLMLACVIAGLPMPLLPIHLLWINLVTDGLPALCLATDAIDPDVMKRPPRRADERITGGTFFRTLLYTGLLTSGVSLAVFIYVLQTEGLEMARTHAFATLVFAELMRAFGARSESRPLWRIPLLSNLNLALVVAATYSLQVWSHHSIVLSGFLKTSLMPLSECLVLALVSLLPVSVMELRKIILERRGTPA